MTDLNPFTVEHVAAGVVRERSADGMLYIFNIDNSNPVTINSWASDVKAVITAWSPKHKCLLMHDLHKIGRFPFEKPMIDQLDQLFAFRPDLERYIAYVSPNTDIVVNLFVEAHMLHVKGNYGVHWALFNSRREGLNWLIKLRNERQ